MKIDEDETDNSVVKSSVSTVICNDRVKLKELKLRIKENRWIWNLMISPCSYHLKQFGGYQQYMEGGISEKNVSVWRDGYSESGEDRSGEQDESGKEDEDVANVMGQEVCSTDERNVKTAISNF